MTRTGDPAPGRGEGRRRSAPGSVRGAREPARIYARARWRRARAALLGLGVVVGAGAAVVLVAVAGARRTATSYERLVAATARHHLSVQDDSEGAATLDAVPGLPGVAVSDRVTLLFGSVGGRQLFVIAGRSGRWGYDLDRPLVLEGRMPRRTADDEILLTETAARLLGARVGRTLAVDTFTRAEFEAAVFGSGPAGAAPSGPTLALRVVGIGRTVGDVDDPQPGAVAPPGVVSRLGADVGAFDNVTEVRLTSPAAAPAFVEAMRALPGHRPEAVYVSDAAQNAGTVGDALAVERLALLAFALVAGLAVAVAGSQAAARQLGGAESDQPALAAMGLTRVQRAAIVLAPIGPTVGVAALVAGLGAGAASPLLPVGLGRRAEPDPGWYADLAVLLPGAAGTALVLVAAAAAAAWRISGAGRPDRGGPAASRRPSTAATAAAGAGLSPAAVTGVRLALEAGRGRAAVPVRPAWGGAVAAVAGVVAVGLFGTGLERLLAEPALAGVTWDAAVGLSDDPDEARAQIGEVRRRPGIGGVTVSDGRQVEIEGADVDLAALRPVRGRAGVPPVLEGRLPAGADEIALGAVTARGLGAGPGDRVRAAADGGGGVGLRVVGVIVVPGGRGGVVTPPGLARLASSDGSRRLLVRWAPGADPARTAASLGADHDLEVASQPAAVANLGRARGMPRLLAVFLAAVGLAAVLHALVVTTRRRRRDLAVLRALGFRRGEVVRAVCWQACTLAAVGLVAGLPLGVAAGRTAWQALARSLGVVHDPGPAGTLVGAVVLSGLVAVNLLALPAAVAAGRRSSAAALRAE